MKLGIVTKDNAELVRQWRNLDIDAYRTSFPLTQEMQEEFYYKTICNRDSKDRFWAVMDGNDDSCFIGMVGLINIELENRRAEISIVIDPEMRGKGKGKQAIDLLLREGFERLNLDNIYGECYLSSPSLPFWIDICHEKGVDVVELPRTKYVNGVYHNSIYFTFARG
jgi:RimJ/RimL family protein N-acetyltransferase